MEERIEKMKARGHEMICKVKGAFAVEILKLPMVTDTRGLELIVKMIPNLLCMQIDYYNINKMLIVFIYFNSQRPSNDTAVFARMLRKCMHNEIGNCALDGTPRKSSEDNNLLTFWQMMTIIFIFTVNSTLERWNWVIFLVSNLQPFYQNDNAVE